MDARRISRRVCKLEGLGTEAPAVGFQGRSPGDLGVKLQKLTTCFENNA